ncbi:MAG TPA: ribosome assembly RNA-binding protein YhbY [Gammaproteobacteria bacterium]|nr:ribosome assembly RNA-binding protein YhbY [Gammaproteobacteria bacterium]
MSLSTKQNQYLRGLAHRLNPVVIIGNAGLTDAVMEEVKLAMNHHELIKVKIKADDRLTRKELCQNIITECQCHHVQSIGHVAVFYKAGDCPKISNLLPPS